MEAIKWDALQAPFVPRWRVQRKIGGDKMVCVAYIDARQVHERLDLVVGPERWQNNYDPETGLSTIGILTDNDWVFKSDVGEDSKVSAIKGKASDAFKRAAVAWGIGRELYGMGEKVLSTKGGVPVTDKGTLLQTPSQISNYLNGISESRALLAQLIKQNPGLKDDQRFKDAINLLWDLTK